MTTSTTTGDGSAPAHCLAYAIIAVFKAQADLLSLPFARSRIG